MDRIKNNIPLIILLVLSYWAVQPLFQPGFFPMHDDTQVARVYEMKQALADGMFPVRWVADLGYNYGYPIFNFYAPFAYYVGGFISLIGVDALWATKLMIALGVLLAGVSMYFFARTFWGNTGGLISAVLYVYAPYHAVNTYVRGAVAELWAYAFLPLAFLGLYRLFLVITSEEHKNKSSLWAWTSVGALGYAGIILSHNLTAMMIMPFLFATAFILFLLARKGKTKKRGYFLFLPIFFGIVLAAFYWLPTLQEMQYTNVTSVVGGKSDVNLHFVCSQQLLDSPWGFGGSGPGCIDGMSFKVGKVHLALTILALFALGFLWKLQRTKFIVASFFFVSLLFSVFLMFNESSFIWNTLHQMAFFQFPWRFLIMVSFFMSFLAGALFFVFQTKFSSAVIYGISGIGLITIILFNAELFIPQTSLQKTAEDYTNKKMMTWTTSKISDEYLPKDFKKPKNQSEVPQNKVSFDDSTVRIVTSKTKTQEITVAYDAPKKTRAVFHIAHFPAWEIFIDNEKVGYSIFNKGLYVTVPSGKHTLSAKFVQTPIEIMANSVSLTGVLALLIGIIITRRKERNHAKTKNRT